MPSNEIQLKADLDQAAANQATKVSYDLEYYKALLALGQGALDRSRSAAQLVQGSAATIGTLYGAVLGVTFSVSDRQLPFRGIAPAVFLGLAIALSSVYVAYMRGPASVQLQALHSSPPERLQRRLNNFFSIISTVVQRRSYWLRSSVIALGVGVVLLPLPFLSFGGSSTPVSPQSLNAAYPWPTPPADRRITALDQTVFKAQVAEIAAQRQQALAPSAQDPAAWIWLVLMSGGVGLVLAIPAVGNRIRRRAETVPD